MSDRPTICLDLDGVVHAYSRGFHDGMLYDDVVPGFWEWLVERALPVARVAILSARFGSANEPDLPAIGDAMRWFSDRYNAWSGQDNARPREYPDVEFCATKPPAAVYIDDRALRFGGDWSADELEPSRLLAMRSWCEPEESSMIQDKPVPRPHRSTAADDELDPSHVLNTIVDEAGKKLAEKLFAHYVRDGSNTSRLPAFLIRLDRILQAVGGVPPQREDGTPGDPDEDYDDDEDMHRRGEDAETASRRDADAEDVRARVSRMLGRR